MNYSKFLIALGFVAIVAACGKNENNNNAAGGLTCNGGYTLQNMNGQNLCCPAQGAQPTPYQYGGAGSCVQPTQSCPNGGMFSQTYNQCLVQGSCSSGYLSYNNQCITYQQAGASINNPNTGYGGGYTGSGYNYGYGYTNNTYPYGSGSYGAGGYGMMPPYGMNMYGSAGFGYGMMNPYMMYNPYMYNQNNYNSYNTGNGPY